MAESLIQFPCHFKVKVIGMHSTELKQGIAEVIGHHFPSFDMSTIHSRRSDKDHYIALTLEVFVESQSMLDAFYQDLTRLPDVKMVL
jgi:putative lipoic acid-binding regulatory protein